MYWTDVAGYPLPKPVGGHPAVDFCNTYAGWNAEEQVERGEWLGDYDRLAVWTAHAELTDLDGVAAARERARAEPGRAAATLDRARALRTALYRCLLDAGDAEAFGDVAAYVTEAAAHTGFRADAEGIAYWVVDEEEPIERPLRLIAQSAGRLLAAPARTHVRACPGDDCGWLFIDRLGRRRWCSMATCGNRAKVRAYEQRRKVER